MLTLLLLAQLTYLCPRAAEAPVIDGRLNDPAWRKTKWTPAFIDIEGPAKPKPRFKTRAKLAYDDSHLYIAAQLEEPHLWATLTQHDSVIFRDNDFEVFLNPSSDGLNYFEFEINALNTGWDLFLNKPYKLKGRADNSWEIPGLKTAVHIDGTLNDPSDRDRGWSLEIAFPFSAFARAGVANPKPGDTWRINFSRVQWRVEIKDGRYHKLKGFKEDNWVWSPQGVVNMHVPERWGYLCFN